MNSPCRLLVLLTLLVPIIVGAEAPMTNLYQASVPLRDRSAGVQAAAIRQGLAQVLVKVSGYSGTPEFAGLQNEVNQAEEYLLEFAFESMPQPAPGGVATQTGEALWMRFNQNLIDALVRQWEIPVWPSSRPQIELTIQASLAGQSILLGPSNYPAAAALLSQNANRRGVHLQLLTPPNGPDIQARTASPALSFDYWGSAELVQDRFGQHQVTFQIYSLGSAPMDYSASDPSLSGAMQMAFDMFVDSVSVHSSYVAAGSGGNLVNLELSGIRSYEAYQHAIDSLNSLEMVDEARVLKLDLNSVQVRVRLASNTALLIDAIRQQGVMVVEGNSLTTTESGAPVLRLNYQDRGP